MLHASLINGLASSIYSFDDTHETAVVHPSGPIAAAVLALAELRPVSGADLLTAFALGVEMTCRLCLGTTVPPADGSFAWSGTGITVGFGAAVAAGRMLRLDTQRMRVAMGLALSEACGFRAMHGSAAVAFMPAHSRTDGTCARRCWRNAVSPRACPALEGKSGYLSVFCTKPNLDALAGDLGERFELLRNTYKPYPCGIVIHPIIDACLKLRQDHRPDPDKIVSVAIQASPGAMALCNNRDPKDEMQAHVSLHHWTAARLHPRHRAHQDMDTETAVKDPALMAFQSKVKATLEPGDRRRPDRGDDHHGRRHDACLPDRARHRQQAQSDVRCRSGTEILRTRRADRRRRPRTRELIDRTWAVAQPAGCRRTGAGRRMTEREFDYIVTGAGSAGCVVAARLSENGQLSRPVAGGRAAPTPIPGSISRSGSPALMSIRR